MRISKERRAELKALAEKASGQFWDADLEREFVQESDTVSVEAIDADGMVAREVCTMFLDTGENKDGEDWDEDVANVKLICASRQALPDALADIEELEAKAGALADFKTFVHKRLDQAGIPTHPDGPHSAEGCRVGDRLDIIQKERDEARAKLAEAVKALEGVKLELNDGCNSLDTTVSARRRESFIDAALAKVRA